MNLTKMTNNNPLLQRATLPKFDQILPRHFKPAIVKMLRANQRAIKKLVAHKKFTWSNFVEPLAAINERLDFVWATICHLNAVVGTQNVRQAYTQCLPLITKYYAAISHHPKIYQAFNALATSKEYRTLNATQKKIIADKLRDFSLAGVTLPPKSKQRFIQLTQKLAKLSNKFACNVIDARQHCLLQLSKQQTKGLPEHGLSLGRTHINAKNQRLWQFTLNQPSYQTLVTFAVSRKVRKKAYIAYVTAASELNPDHKKWDNTNTIIETLATREQLANLVSFNNYATYSLATKMANNPNEVLDFLHNLNYKTLALAKKELRELARFAKQHGINQLKPWDLAYYGEKLQQAKFNLSQEELRPYFPIERVISGICEIVKRLYGITIKEQAGTPTWHQDVRFFALYDHNHNLQGQFYLDLYCRPHKQSGAWMDDYQPRYRLKNNKIQHPLAIIVCNFAPPLDNKPALLTHHDVLTLLHEFGHALQHLLTTVDYIAASGIKGVPWDAVEVASQFMENWGWQQESIQLMAEHYTTKKPLPPALLKRLLASRTYHAALYMLRQLELALLDFNLHLKPKITVSTQLKKITNAIKQQTRIIPSYKYERTLHTFSHIFAGAYAAGYYSYTWAEVMAADAFSKFEETGLFNRHTGQRFLRWMLQTGGSADPLILFKKFRGRPPQIDALLKHYGIPPASN